MKEFGGFDGKLKSLEVLVETREFGGFDGNEKVWRF